MCGLGDTCVCKGTPGRMASGRAGVLVYVAYIYVTPSESIPVFGT